MVRKIKNKRGISPIVSTVLLIMIVIIIAIIILLWTKGFINEVVTKTIAGEEKRAEKYCQEVELSSSMGNDGFITIQNTGNVPVYAFDIKVKGDGGSDSYRVSDSSVNRGENLVINDEDYNIYEEVKLIPILFGTTESGINEEFPCPEKYGVIV